MQHKGEKDSFIGCVDWLRRSNAQLLGTIYIWEKIPNSSKLAVTVETIIYAINSFSVFRHYSTRLER